MQICEQNLSGEFMNIHFTRCVEHTEWPKISENTAIYDSVIDCRLNACKLYLFILLMKSHDVICSSEFVFV